MIGILALQAPAPLLVSLDANGDCIESYSVLNVQSSGGLTSKVIVGLYSLEKPDWKYANMRMLGSDAHMRWACRVPTVSRLLVQVPPTAANRCLARCASRSSCAGRRSQDRAPVADHWAVEGWAHHPRRRGTCSAADQRRSELAWRDAGRVRLCRCRLHSVVRKRRDVEAARNEGSRRRFRAG